MNKSKFQGTSRQVGIPPLVLLLSLSLTLVVTYYFQVSTAARDQFRFQNVVHKTEGAIERRMETYIALLRAVAALFDASERVELSEFRAFANRIDVQRNYPGIQGVGFSRRLLPEEKEAYVAQMREGRGEAFNIRPEGERAEYHSITYLEPQDRRNQVAIGYDMFTEPIRHTAMSRARDSGAPAMSGKVTLVQEIEGRKQAGFLIYVPIYRHGMPSATVAERQAALDAFAYSPFRADDLMQGIFGKEERQEISFKIFAGTEPDDDALLHDSSIFSADSRPYTPLLTTTRQVEIAGFPWTIAYSSRPEFEAGSARGAVGLALLMGVLASLVLFGLALAQAKARIKAQRLADELFESQKKLLENERLKSQFLANVSHELRTPLTLTLAPVESLLAGEYGVLAEGQSTILQTMHNNAVRLLQMVTGLLDFSKLEAGKVEVKREPTPVAQLTQTVLADFGSFATQRGLAITHDPPSETVVDLDRYLYERILFNLMSNAVKFTPAGGTVSVSLIIGDGRLRLAVADTGPGIPESEVPQLFQRFRQAEGSSTRRFEGTGLGLALVKEFARLLDGDVSVASTVGKGSRFTVEVLAPASRTKEVALASRRPEARLAQQYRPASVTTTPAAETVSTPSGALPKLLIVEDNVEMAVYITTLLKDMCQTRVAQDGEEALQMVRQWLPDAVLSDVMMPKRDGLSLCREIKSHPETAKIPVVLLTALTHREALLKGWEAGADEYLFKPFHPKELVTRINAILATMRTAKKMEQTLLQSEKMAAVGQLAGGVAHELNNPLGVILGFAQSAARRLSPGDPLELPLKSIEREAVRCKALVQDLLTFSRVGKLEKEDLDVNQTLDSSLSLVLAQSRVKNAELVREFSPDLPKLFANKNQIQQIIVNLCNNAMDAMPQGGKLILRTQRSRLDDKDAIEIQVQDTGHGIPNESLPRLFEPFFTTKEVGKGTGLGLSLVYEIVRKHGGQIKVESEVGQGACFRIYLPLQQAGRDTLGDGR